LEDVSKGQFSDAVKLPTESIIVLENDCANKSIAGENNGVAIYCRVSNNASNLERQVEKLREYAIARGYQIKYIVAVNPAYSDQECSSCGYLDKENKENTQEFECKCGGNKINAQVNEAKNILKRSSFGSLYLSKKQVLKALIEKLLERLQGKQECSPGCSQEKSLLQGLS